MDIERFFYLGVIPIVRAECPGWQHVVHGVAGVHVKADISQRLLFSTRLFDILFDRSYT